MKPLRLFWGAFVVYGSLVMLTGCTETSSSPRQRVTSTAVPPADPPCGDLPPLGALPDGFPNFTLPPDSLVLRPQRAGRGWIRADLFVDGSVREAQEHFLDSLPNEGANVLTSEYEGFDAEVYFTYQQEYVGIVQVVDRCGDGVLVAVRLEKPR